MGMKIEVAVLPEVRVGEKPSLAAHLRKDAFGMNELFMQGYSCGVSGVFGPYQRTHLAESKRLIAEVRAEFGFAAVDAPLLTPPSAQHKLEMASVPSYGLTLAHADLSGYECCSWRTPTCTAGCVLNNGNGRYDSVQRAWLWRTEFFARHRRLAAWRLGYELGKAARKDGRILFRPDVNTDLSWHRIIEAMGRMGGVTPYGYTKNPAVLGESFTAEGWHYAYSWSENSNRQRVGRHLLGGGKVAVVTNRKKNQPVDAAALREFFGVHGGVRVVDADVTDEWIVAKGAAIGDLTAKGAIRKSIGVTAFVVVVY